MTRLKNIGGAFCALLLGLAPTAGADSLSREYRQTGYAIADAQILPAYESLAAGAVTMQQALSALCADTGNWTEVEQAFHGLADRWMAIEYFGSGPVAFDARHQKLHYWPDKHGTGARQLRNALANEDQSLLAPGAMADASAALQGIGTLERVLFDPQPLTAADAYRCALGTAAATNIGDITGTLVREWRFPDAGYLWAISTSDAGNGYFDAPSEVILMLLKALQTELLVMRDQKIGRVIADGGRGFRLNRAESWRSSRSIRNLRINARALTRLFEGVADTPGSGLADLVNGRPEISKALSEGFVNLTTALDALPDGYASLDSPQALQPVLEALDNLLLFTGTPLHGAMGFTAGFNALDGD